MMDAWGVGGMIRHSDPCEPEAPHQPSTPKPSINKPPQKRLQMRKSTMNMRKSTTQNEKEKHQHDILALTSNYALNHYHEPPLAAVIRQLEGPEVQIKATVRNSYE